MEYAYLAVTFGVGVWLYRRHPGSYIFFTWWLWFLTPEVRRLIDYVQGYSPASPAMLAPYLVSSLTLFAVAYHLPKLRLNRYFPFLLISLGVSYAYAVGVYHGGVFGATFQLVEWSVPVAFAFYLIVNWRKYPVYRRATLRAFVLAVPVMGVYGLIQFFYLPPWDQYWMLNTDISSFGKPEPLQLRVFSTLNSQTPFADVMLAGLLLLLGGGGLLRWSAAAAGYASFALSLVRQAWGGWIVGLLFIIAQRRRLRPASLLALMVTVLAILPLLAVGPAADRINERLETFTDLTQDKSFEARVEFYQEFASLALYNPVGEGYGSTGAGTRLSASGVGDLGENAAFDSGILEIPYLLGWPGTVLYIGGLVWILFYVFHGKNSEDLFAVASRGIVVGTLAQLPFNDKTDGLPGMVLWTFIGLAIAAEAHRSQTSRDAKNAAVSDGWRGGQRADPEYVARESVAGSRSARSAGRIRW